MSLALPGPTFAMRVTSTVRQPIRLLTSLRALRLGVSISALTCAMFLARHGRAEDNGYLIDGDFGLGTGLEGGDSGSGKLGWRRARLRITTGVDLRSDESQADALGFRAFAELEKRATLGGEARYERWLSHNVGAYAGLIGEVAPNTLFGGSVGATFVLPLGKRAGLFFEPSFSVMPVGSDLPSNAPLIWLLLSVGIKVGL